MTQKNVFSAAEILLPKLAPQSDDFSRWAVIACDQFTSNTAYWDECERIIGGRPSAYDYILPEAFLGTERGRIKDNLIKKYMAGIKSADFITVSGFVYVERTLSNGKVRRGIVGKIDLEAYDYSPDSKSTVRASEMTVADRLPPRAKIRAAATIELPHVLVFIDSCSGVIEAAEKAAKTGRLVYDFDLMQSGGHVRGFALEDTAASVVSEAVAKYEGAASLPYAVGDGNHSLAAAKLHYENIKKSFGNSALDHPARYALCEIVSLGDEAIKFEPIYRTLTGLNEAYDEFFSTMCAVTKDTYTDRSECVKLITAKAEKNLIFTAPSHALTVGTLQNIIDKFISKHPEVSCDYIHGKNEAEEIGRHSGCAAFIFDGIAKEELLPYIEIHGVLPRKTFSMGDAHDKRYYLEARRITL